MPQRVMGVAAHPDDLEWFAGGTVAGLARGGAEVTLVLCTDGSSGSADPRTDRAELAVRRRTEQQGAASILGIREVVFLDHLDGELEATLELRRQLAGLYRRHRPELLLAFDPWKRYELHPDHLAAGRAALDARLAARMPLCHPELGLEPWSVPELWLFNPDEPNHHVDVSDTAEAQLRALEAHRSQPSVWDTAARSYLEARARRWGRAMGVQFAEAFRRLEVEGATNLALGT
jgi:LmbE family N-acetylglucosaminyl deacetylase